MPQTELDRKRRYLMKRLAHFEPYLTSAVSSQGSAYIKLGKVPEAGTIRISDHLPFGKRAKYRFRWNLILGGCIRSEPTVRHVRYFYNEESLDEMIRHINAYCNRCIKNRGS